MSSNSDHKKTQLRNVSFGLGAIAVLAFGAAWLTGDNKKPTQTNAQRKEAEPVLKNIMVPGAVLADKDAWRAGAGAELSEVKKQLSKLQDQLEIKEREEKDKVAREAKEKLDREKEKKSPTLSPIATFDPKTGGTVEPRIVTGSATGTPGVVQAGTPVNSSNGLVSANQVYGRPLYPPGSPNGLGTPINGQNQAIRPSSQIKRLDIDAEDEPVSSGAKGAATERRLPLVDPDKMNFDNSRSESPTERVSYNNKVVKETKTTQNYLPSGSFAEALFLNGFDAPSGGQAQNNPVPFLLTLSSHAFLPSRMRSEIKECFVTGNAYGDVSSERAYGRTDSLSCVKTDGTAIDMPIKGYLVGEDGKAGVRGRLVTKQGQILANALSAGFISGLGNAISYSGSTTTTTPFGGTTQTPNAGSEARAGFGTAFGKSMDKLANYYISLADKTFPVIEVDARRKVTVVISRGTFIDNRVTPKDASFTNFQNLITNR